VIDHAGTRVSLAKRIGDDVPPTIFLMAVKRYFTVVKKATNVYLKYCKQRVHSTAQKQVSVHQAAGTAASTPNSCHNLFTLFLLRAHHRLQ
jgi:hypothetical protein